MKESNIKIGGLLIRAKTVQPTVYEVIYSRSKDKEERKYEINRNNAAKVAIGLLKFADWKDLWRFNAIFEDRTGDDLYLKKVDECGSIAKFMKTRIEEESEEIRAKIDREILSVFLLGLMRLISICEGMELLGTQEYFNSRKDIIIHSIVRKKTKV